MKKNDLREITVEISIQGMVQGIGYRPFIAKLAEALNYKGSIINIAGIVRITITDKRDRINSFVNALWHEKPFGARIDEISVKEISYKKYDTFTIELVSEKERNYADCRVPFIPPDLSTCPECERELFDINNRRYKYPFISCVKCGPRYSIIEKLPYDRERTTMNDFSMCKECHDEYNMQMGIRRFAQTISCKDCGPYLIYTSDMETFERETAYITAVNTLKADGIIAVKDIGGYHLVCSPFSSEAVAKLRELKARDKKPFAVMFANIQQLEGYCHISNNEKLLLSSNPRPVVLIKKRTNPADTIKRIDEKVAFNSEYIGAMLPCNPLQLMLLKDLGPLIMTSANKSQEAIIIDDKYMLSWMSDQNSKRKLLNGVLYNTRRILLPLDDSVIRCVHEDPLEPDKLQIIRRARGYVPEPVVIKNEKFNCGRYQIFAAGGDLKATFCFLTDNRAYLSQQLGDIESLSVEEWYNKIKYHMQDIFGFKPQYTVCDMHPGYITVNNELKKINASISETNLLSSDGKKYVIHNNKLIQIWHHHAHIASVIAEHGLEGSTLGVAYDGTGYGTDSSVWGSEFLLCEGIDFKRVGHLQPVTLIGGSEGARNTKTILLGYLISLNIDMKNIKYLIKSNLFSESEYNLTKAAINYKINTVTSTSMGRLFDAVSCLIGICNYNGYEGQAAIELEQMAALDEALKEEGFNNNCNNSCNNSCNLTNAEDFVINIKYNSESSEYSGELKYLFEEIINALYNGISRKHIAKSFHDCIAQFTVNMINTVISEQKDIASSIKNIALSGGTFQNRLLLERIYSLYNSDKGCLSDKKKPAIYRNVNVPSTDAGLCLGQAYLAAKILQEEYSED